MSTTTRKTLGELTIEEAAKQAAGNHTRFECFAWFGRPDDSEDWAIIYTHNRDSGPLDLSNAEVIAEALAPFAEAEPADVVFESHNHWAVGSSKNGRLGRATILSAHWKSFLTSN